MHKASTLRAVSLIAAVSVIASGIAVAQDAIAKRKELMKSNGAAAKASTEMTSGVQPFDAAKAKSHMDRVAAGMKEFPTLFPRGSDKGDTRASPEIWKDTSKFEAAARKLSSDATAASAAAAKGPDAFKASLGEVTKNCKSCHDQFRLEKK